MLKRKPPAGNVRRVAPIGLNLRGVLTNKADVVVQYESFAEFIFALRTDRDPLVENYRSQPEIFKYYDEVGNQHSYTPDFQVWKTDGQIEIHEITRSERRTKLNAQRREKGATDLCEERGWQYTVHTEEEFSSQAEIANLVLLFAFRPKVYYDKGISLAVTRLLKQTQKLPLQEVITDTAQNIRIAETRVYKTVCHLIWQSYLDIDFKTLLVTEGQVNPRTSIWLLESNKN